MDNINENIKYELLAKEIYETLLQNQGYNTIDVQHNVKIKGKSGCEHQIDVFWEFEIADEIHKVIIECKNFNSNVSIAKVRDFFGVAYDIGNVKGIFISKVGFQKGAKIFADYYGISLKELRDPTEDDWKGRLKTIIFNIGVVDYQNVVISFMIDAIWLKNNDIVKSQEELDRFNQTVKFSHTGNELQNFWLYDENGNKKETCLDLFQSVPMCTDAQKGKILEIDCESSFVESNYGKVKVHKLQFTYDIVIEKINPVKVDAENIVKAILKDVKSGGIKFFNNDGTIK